MTRGRTVVAVGEFDGMHVGHQALAAATVELARRWRAQAVAVVLDDGVDRPHVSTPTRRVTDALAGGFEHAHVLAVPAGAPESVAHTIVDAIQERFDPMLAALACLPGIDSAVHYPRLRPSLRRAGIEIVEVPRAIDRSGAQVTSGTVIRALDTGDVARVSELLGRPARVTGPVTLGDQRGRLLGFPTANVDAPTGLAIPAHGVYAGRVRWDTESWPAAVNVGVRPTFYASEGQLLVEAHLIGYEGDLYGRVVDIDFVERIRDERRFDGVDALVDQLRRDVAEAAAITGA